MAVLQIGDRILVKAHRRLLAGSRLEEMGGTIREEQNWIGGSSYNPCSAAFVPPPPEYVPELLEDLCNFANSDSLSAVAQAALAHAQFETIHPFVDGNGRIGRASPPPGACRPGASPNLARPGDVVAGLHRRAYGHQVPR
jgi:Fic family protein